MPFRHLSSFALCAFLLVFLPQSSLAQFAPWQAPNLTTITSPIDPSIKISYRVPTGVCTTAYDTQQQYTGWVTVPGNNFTTNLFFWFVAARQQTSALTIWLNGGPGSSSMFGFFDETGPCEIIEKGANQLGTAVRDWGWDRASNMLFIDQPNQVGFSYDVPTNGSMDMILGTEITPAQAIPTDRTAQTFLNGTFSSLSANNTANTTETAALAVWHMLQGFLATFPQYNPGNASLGVSLFAESYGGKYGPVFAETWEEQNAKRQNGSLFNATSLDIHLSSLGIMNGCVDDEIQGPSYTEMMVNNPYGLQLLNSVRAALVNASYYQANGCLDMIYQCRNATLASDPGGAGNVSSVNDICEQATTTCNQDLIQPYSDFGRSLYDIAHQLPESFPPCYYIDYLNTADIQMAIGSPVNFTDTSSQVYSAFMGTGDWERTAMVPKLAALLQKGVRVGLVYGDRDFICNWIGGEAVSLSVASSLGGSYAANFPTSGYAPIIVNSSYIGGVVRQYGNLSFSRVYQAGHFVPAYQPETAFQVFARILLGTSISTGEAVNLSTYNTSGPLNATSSLILPPSPTQTCYIGSIPDTCESAAVSGILNGQGVIINGVWYAASSNWPGATMSSTVSGTATPTTSSTTATLTGVYTATATPSSIGPIAAPAWSLVFAAAASFLFSLL
jgi:carboxypeptidase C (cathepsin A)